MSVTVNTNVSALTAQRYLNKSTNDLGSSMEKLSSGSRINSAKDDAAGLQISNRLQKQMSGINVAMRNANDGISMAQTAEGGMNETASILGRMRDLSVQSSNGNNTQTDRDAIQEEIVSLQDELDRIAETTSFGGTKLLNGEFGTKSFQIGADSGEAINMTLLSVRANDMGANGLETTEGTERSKVFSAAELGDGAVDISYTAPDGKQITDTFNLEEGNLQEMATQLNGHNGGNFQVSVKEGVDSETGEYSDTLQLVFDNDAQVSFSGAGADALGLSSAQATDATVRDIDVTSVDGSQRAIGILDEALAFVDSERSQLGAVQNRLDHTVSNLGNISENVAQSNSRIRDVDFAKETTEMTKSQILQQASTSILAQAKMAPQSALSLLG